MQSSKVILEKGQFTLTLKRLARQLIENHGDFSNTCIVGIQERGVFLANRLLKILDNDFPDLAYKYGKLDITFYRDDFRRRDNPLSPSTTEMDFLVEGSNVILIDDVLYTGRTIQAAMSALSHYGRAKKVELLTLVNRRFNRNLPIEADYTGINVDSMDEAYVKVEWEENAESDRIFLISPEKN